MSFFKKARPLSASADGNEAGTDAEERGQGARTESPPAEDLVLGERGIPSINRARSLQSRMSSILAVGLMSAMGCGLLTFYYAGAITRQGRAQAAAQSLSKSRAQGEMALPALGPIEPPPVRNDYKDYRDPPAVERLLGSPPALPGETSVPELNRSDPGSPEGAAYGDAVRKPSALARRLSGAVFAKESGDLIGPAGGGTRGPAEAEAEGLSGRAAGALPAGERPSPASGRGELADLLRPSLTPAVRAQLLPTRRLLLPKGAFIDCTLETAIDSTLPGMTTCITATDTFSADGTVVLLERGTKLVGETRGQVQQGAARVFVLWTQARTPTGVVVPLDSPGTDELGRAGLSGEVNRHFWQRFGAGILVSVVNGAMQVAAASHSSGSAVILNPSSSQDVITEILKDTVAIAPTVTKAQGDRIQILVARDLDFRPVYELHAVATAAPAGGDAP